MSKEKLNQLLHQLKHGAMEPLQEIPTQLLEDVIDPLPTETVEDLCPDHQLPAQFTRLPRELQDVMTCIDKLYGVDPALSLQVVLGTVNTAIYDKFNVVPIDWAQERGVSTALYLGNVTESGGMKSTILQDVAEPIYQYQEDQKRLVGEEIKRHRLLQAKYQKAYVKWSNNADSTLDDAPVEPAPVATKNLILQNATRNGVIDTLATQCAASFITDEGGELFNSHSFKDGQKNKGTFFEALAFFTKLWSGDAVDRVIGKNKDNPDAHISLYNRRLSMTFLTQAAPVRELLNNEDASNQGFLHRFLLTQAQDVPVRRMTEVDRQRNAKLRLLMRPFKRRIRELLEQPRQQFTDRPFEVYPQLIHVRAEDWDVISHWHDYMVTPRRWEMPIYSGFFNRAVEHCVRLAANIAVFAGRTEECSTEDVLAAIDLMNYYIDQRGLLDLGVATRNADEIQKRDLLYAWILDYSKTHTGTELTARMIQQYGPAWYRRLTSRERDLTIDNLVSNYMVETRRQGKSTVISVYRDES